MKIIPEDKIQQEIVMFFNNSYCLKHHGPRGLIFAVPNGGTRNTLEAVKLKNTGLLKGVSDLIVILPNGKILFIEVKRENGTQQSEQKEFAIRVNNLGYEYHLVRSLSEFKSILTKHYNDKK